MTVKGGTSPACAACKYQRRRCSSECVLAPYFPANQTKAFRNAHRLFGVSNIVKILKQLDTDEQKEEAMKSIKYEADMRERYPVYGCAGIICQLRQQIRQATEELHYVYAQLAGYRDQFNYRIASSATSHSSPSSHLQLGISSGPGPTIDAPLPLFQHQSVGSEIPFFFMTDEYDNHINTDSTHHLGKPLVGLEPYYDLTRNDNAIVDSDAGGIYQDFAYIPFNATTDDRQSYVVETKEACESSSESSFRDFQHSVDQVSKIDLRNAAACFSLTNIK